MALFQTVERFTDSMSYSDYIDKCCSQAWKPFFESQREELNYIYRKINEMRKIKRIFPLHEFTFRIYELLPPQDVRVIILGQDPYDDLGKDYLPKATGVAFSTRKTAGLPPSFREIYKELENSIPRFTKPSHGCLDYWISQGVFLLNASLTVYENNKVDKKDTGHKAIWKEFVLNTINYLLKVNPNIMVLLWGKKAQEIEDKLNTKNILTAPHPSPMNQGYNKFSGCGHFVKVNRHLALLEQKEIDWKLYD